MRKIIAGGIILFSGIVLYLGVHVPAAFHTQNIGSWSTPPGRYGTALEETGGSIGLIFSVTLCILGILLLLWGVFSNQIHKIQDSTKKERNER